MNESYNKVNQQSIDISSSDDYEMIAPSISLIEIEEILNIGIDNVVSGVQHDFDFFAELT